MTDKWFYGLFVADFTDAGHGGRVVDVQGNLVFYSPFGMEDQYHCLDIDKPGNVIFYVDREVAFSALREHVEKTEAQKTARPIVAVSGRVNPYEIWPERP